MATQPDAWAHADRLVKRKRERSNKRLLAPIEDVLSRRNDEKQGERDTAHLHPSELSKVDFCERAAAYKLMDTEESNPDLLSLRRLNIFAEGDAIHDKWQSWLREAGILVGNWKCTFCTYEWWGRAPQYCPECYQGPPRYREVPIAIEDRRIIGHADGLIEDSDGEAVVEIKSVGLGTIRWDAPKMYAAFEAGSLSLDDLWKRIRKPVAPHSRQVQLYMHALEIPKAIVLYEWKPTQEVKEFHLDYDAELVNKLLAKADVVWEHVDSGVLPDRPEGAEEGSRMCRFCPYRGVCYDAA